MTPPEVLVLPEQGDWQVRVVPNLYPALERQEVVVHSRRHVRSLADLEDDELELVAEAWRHRAQAHAGYVHALVNEGRDAGSSLPHSHSQLVWLPETPPARARPRGEPFLERGGLTATCPWASRLPYEAVIAPVEPTGEGLASPLLGPALKLLAGLVRRGGNLRQHPAARGRSGPTQTRRAAVGGPPEKLFSRRLLRSRPAVPTGGRPPSSPGTGARRRSLLRGSDPCPWPA